jgi:hypothetical protein
MLVKANAAATIRMQFEDSDLLQAFLLVKRWYYRRVITVAFTDRLRRAAM